MINTKIQSIIYSVLGGFLLLVLPASVYASTESVLANMNDPNATLCMALANVIPCGATPQTTSSGSTGNTNNTTNTGTTAKTTSNTTSSSQPVSVASIFGSIFGIGSGSSSTTTPRNLSANISQGFLGKTQKNEAVVLVKDPKHPEVYRIIGGKKFLIPNDTVFDSYGYLRSDIKTMSWSKIMSYPRVKLIKDGNPDVYYLTEGGMTRVISSQTVFDSYVDNDQDVVVVNKTEFSMYPQNKYIFNESTYTFNRAPNVYLIGNGTKSLIFPDQLARDGVTNTMIAPVNQTEFDYYSVFLASATKQRTWFNFF